MWPTFNNIQEDSSSRRPLTFPELLKGIGDLSNLATNDSALKFWLPEPAEHALNEMGERSGISMSEFLRQFFIVHCYGLYAFYAMKDARIGLFKEPEPKARVFYQGGSTGDGRSAKKRIETYWVPELGKNIAPVKVWMPARLRNDLASLAQHAGLTLSNYVREIVISRLLGHGMLPMRPEIFQVLSTAAAEDWAGGRSVSWRQISEDEYRISSAAEVRS
ncbi:hypothetical protein A7976_05660 [Methylobacillus sp. MM3]|nr:hypothetical protein A7976_05660 [Methylobacillus sp. MM3]